MRKEKKNGIERGYRTTTQTLGGGEGMPKRDREEKKEKKKKKLK
jgi:hypothetical protein